jgi:Chaperone of endosialidase
MILIFPIKTMLHKLSLLTGVLILINFIDVIAQSITLSPTGNILKTTAISINNDASLPSSKLHIKGVGSLPTVTAFNSPAYTSIASEANPASSSSEIFSVYAYATNASVQNAGVFGLSGSSAIFNVGVLGMSTFDGLGDNFGVKGVASNNNSGASFGVFGSGNGNPTTRASYGVYGEVTGTGTKYAGFFDGNVTVTGVFSSASDFKLKNNLSKLKNGLSTVLKLSPYSYEYETIAGMNLPEGFHHGFIAQDVQSILPELVLKAIQPAKYDAITKKKISNEVEFLSVNYMEMIPILVKAIQEQQMQIELLKEEVVRLKNK